jgi:hypothetical protein
LTRPRPAPQYSKITETLDDVTWNRIKRYHVLVIYITPDAMDVTMRGMKPSVEKAKSFADLIERYIAAGGGVLLMPSEGNMLKQAVVDLTAYGQNTRPNRNSRPPLKLGRLISVH